MMLVVQLSSSGAPTTIVSPLIATLCAKLSSRFPLPALMYDCSSIGTASQHPIIMVASSIVRAYGISFISLASKPVFAAGDRADNGLVQFPWPIAVGISAAANEQHARPAARNFLFKPKSPAASVIVPGKRDRQSCQWSNRGL